MCMILELRDRTSHAGITLVHPKSEHVVLANVFGIVKNLSFDAALNPWLIEVTGNADIGSDDWKFSFWEKQERPTGVQEGSTEVDLVLFSETTLVFVEVKMDAEPSGGTAHDPERNQLIRNLDVGYRRAQDQQKAFAVVYVTPDMQEPRIVSRIHDEDQSFPANRGTNPTLISQCFYWSSWSMIADVLAQSYEKDLLSDIEKRFSMDLLAYLAKKRLWQNSLTDDPIFYGDKLYRSLQKTNSSFVPYSKQSTERDESWRGIAWEAEALRALLRKLRWEDKLLLKVLADADGAMRQNQLMQAIPFLNGKNSASLRSLKSHVNAQCKGCGKAPILAVGTGSGGNRLHQINPALGELRQVVIEEATKFNIPPGLLG